MGQFPEYVSEQLVQSVVIHVTDTVLKQTIILSSRACMTSPGIMSIAHVLAAIYPRPQFQFARGPFHMAVSLYSVVDTSTEIALTIVTMVVDRPEQHCTALLTDIGVTDTALVTVNTEPQLPHITTQIFMIPTINQSLPLVLQPY